MKLSDTVTATGPVGQTSLTADIEFTEMVYEAAFAYRLASNERITADVVAGVRIWALSTEVDLSGAFVENGISQDDLWVDPLVGARVLWHFADRWSLIGRGDIGGFGVGSDFAWNASAYVGFEAAAGAPWCWDTARLESTTTTRRAALGHLPTMSSPAVACLAPRSPSDQRGARWIHSINQTSFT